MYSLASTIRISGSGSPLFRNIKLCNYYPIHNTVSVQLHTESKNDDNALVLKEVIGQKQNVALLTLNRPHVLNALSTTLMEELSRHVKNVEADPRIAAIILTGAGRAFAAGADIKEMGPIDFANLFCYGKPKSLALSICKKPIIAAVNGLALGGGCELALLCDIIYASENAKFGQPEILIGTIPGAGATQRIVKAAGKSKAMEICLTGKQFSAHDAETMKLVSKVVPLQELIPESLALAEKIGSNSKITTRMVKEAIIRSFEVPLAEGLRLERHLADLTFATEDQKEGMTAFVEKRTPMFHNK